MLLEISAMLQQQNCQGLSKSVLLQVAAAVGVAAKEMLEQGMLTS